VFQTLKGHLHGVYMMHSSSKFNNMIRQMCNSMYCAECIVHPSSSMIATAVQNTQYSLKMILQELKHVGMTYSFNKGVIY